MSEETKEDVNNITKKISDIYQQVFSMENTQTVEVQYIKTELNIMHKQLQDIKTDLDNQLVGLYNNGANEIDSEVNQIQREIQEINNWMEDIIPDLLTYIQEKYGNNNVDNVTIETEMKEEILLEENLDNLNFGAESFEKEKEIDIEIEKEEIVDEPEQVPEEVSKIEPEIYEIFAQENESVPEVVTVKLVHPSNDYKNIAENIVNVRNCSLPEPSRAIEEGAVASEQVIENIKNILMKDI